VPETADLGLHLMHLAMGDTPHRATKVNAEKDKPGRQRSDRPRVGVQLQFEALLEKRLGVIQRLSHRIRTCSQQDKIVRIANQGMALLGQTATSISFISLSGASFQARAMLVA
jgi:hypothetical protein